MRKWLNGLFVSHVSKGRCTRWSWSQSSSTIPFLTTAVDPSPSSAFGVSGNKGGVIPFRLNEARAVAVSIANLTGRTADLVLRVRACVCVCMWGLR